MGREWVKLAYYLPISWETYIKAPLTLRYTWFSELAEIRREMAGKGGGGFTGSLAGDRKAGFE